MACPPAAATALRNAISHRRRKQDCYQRALLNQNQTGCHCGSNHNWKQRNHWIKRNLSLGALLRLCMNTKGAFTYLCQNAQLPYTVTKVCWFLIEFSLMEIPNKNEHLLMSVKDKLLNENRHGRSSYISLRWVEYVSVPWKWGGVGFYTELNIL